MMEWTAWGSAPDCSPPDTRQVASPHRLCCKPDVKPQDQSLLTNSYKHEKNVNHDNIADGSRK